MSEQAQNEAKTSGGSVTEGLPKGFTYFVRDGDMIKIGSSMRPEERISALQTGCSRQLEVLAIVSQEIAAEFETHQLFAHLRVRGEWFRADQELLYFIEGVKAHTALEVEPTPVPLPAPAAPAPLNERAMIRQLNRLRAAHGFDTPMGHACSNIGEQLPHMANYVRPEWATHECQTLPWMMKQQLKRIAELRTVSH